MPPSGRVPTLLGQARLGLPSPSPQLRLKWQTRPVAQASLSLGTAAAVITGPPAPGLASATQNPQPPRGWLTPPLLPHPSRFFVALINPQINSPSPLIQGNARTSKAPDDVLGECTGRITQGRPSCLEVTLGVCAGGFEELFPEQPWRGKFPAPPSGRVEDNHHDPPPSLQDRVKGSAAPSPDLTLSSLGPHCSLNLLPIP